MRTWASKISHDYLIHHLCIFVLSDPGPAPLCPQCRQSFVKLHGTGAASTALEFLGHLESRGACTRVVTHRNRLPPKSPPRQHFCCMLSFSSAVTVTAARMFYHAPLTWNGQRQRHSVRSPREWDFTSGSPKSGILSSCSGVSSTPRPSPTIARRRKYRAAAIAIFPEEFRFDHLQARFRTSALKFSFTSFHSHHSQQNSAMVAFFFGGCDREPAR
jgi:hypothetical protein